MNPSTTATTGSETTLWKGSTSQWMHFWYYLICLLLAAGAIVGAAFTGGLAAIGLFVPIGMWAVRWYATRSTVYELTTERLRTTAGILNRREDELELYRVKDYAVERPFVLRMMGLGNLTIVTADASTPTVFIKAIAGVEAVRDHLRQAVESARDRKRVRQMDVDSLDDHSSVEGGHAGH